MSRLWLRFGCFLIGYNYGILANCSEVAAKAVKRYTAAMLIIGIIWAFIGYNFTSRYVGGGTIASIAGAFIALIVVIQIERQIILTVHKSPWLGLARGVIAIVMALIGSVIIDQIIFREDIEQAQISMMDDKVDKFFPGRAKELKRQINELDSTILSKEREVNAMEAEVSKKPKIVIYNTETSTSLDSLDNPIIARKTSSSEMPNPKMAMIQPMRDHVRVLYVQKAQKDSILLTLRPQIVDEIKSNVGFLDELQVMFKIVGESKVALVMWLLWILLLFSFEILVLVSKLLEKGTDYDDTILHQMALQRKRLDLYNKTT